MTEPTETERAKLNERLARAMGIPDDHWMFQCLKDDHLLDGHGPHAFCLTCAAPVNKSALVPPDFTRDPAASRELVEWVAADQNRATEFIKLLWRSLEPRPLLPPSDAASDWQLGLFVMAFMTADLLLKAQAADAAIGGQR